MVVEDAQGGGGEDRDKDGERGEPAAARGERGEGREVAVRVALEEVGVGCLVGDGVGMGRAG